MLAVSSNRTKLYILQMAKHQVLPARVVYMEIPSESTPESQAVEREAESGGTTNDNYHGFDLSVPVPDLLETLGVPFVSVDSLDPNSELVVNAVAQCQQSILIYSGPGGAILRKQILSTGKRFLHTHSGILPFFRGSTTVYYSLLKEGDCGATAFFMDEQIDTGHLIRTQRFPAPQDRTTIDLYYDPLIRSQLLVEVLQEYVRSGEMPLVPQDSLVGDTYYIIHPVLKHIAILAGQMDQSPLESGKRHS